MSAQGLAFTTPKLVRWAREREGISQNQLAKTLHATQEQITDWEQGNSYPPFGKALSLARALHVPFGYLFLSEVPSEDLPLPDLRTRAKGPVPKPSTDFLELLNGVLLKQDWYREYAKESGASDLAFVGRFNATSAAADVARDLRNTLSIDEKLRKASGSWSDFLSRLVGCSENAGILVMRSGIVGANTRRKLSVKEFQGFAICDPIAPLVFINSRDFKAAQIFTLAHELAHIWIGRSGISNPNPAAIPDQNSQNNIEHFCNSVAAEVLTPTADFLDEWRDDLPHRQAAQSLAHHFRVSTIVVLRRAFELKKIAREVFFRLVKEEQERVRKIKSSGDGGGNFYNTLPARNSPKLTDTVLTALQRGRVLYRDAANLLGVKVETLNKLTEARRKR